jgi:hypothetical protein
MQNRTLVGENICSWGKVVRSPTAATKSYTCAALAEPRVATRTNDPPCPRPGKPRTQEARDLDRWTNFILNQLEIYGTCGHDPLPANFSNSFSAADAAFAR